MINAEWRIRSFRSMETGTVAHQMADHRKQPHDVQVAYSYNWADRTANYVYTFEPRLQETTTEPSAASKT